MNSPKNQTLEYGEIMPEPVVARPEYCIVEDVLILKVDIDYVNVYNYMTSSRVD